MASRRQIAANRENGLKGGVKTEEGKLISRLNARKHGIFASALTTEDSEQLYDVEDRFIASLRPVGPLEETLVEKLALTYLRMQRCARAEAEYHVRAWEEPNKERDRYAWDLLQKRRECGARAVIFREDEFERMVKLIDLYDARLTNQFLKLIHEIERLQRLRADEDAPWPAAADPTVQAEAEDVARPPSAVVCHVPAGASEQAPAPSDTEPFLRTLSPTFALRAQCPKGQDERAGRTCGATANAQPRSASGTVPHTPEQAPAPAPEQSQVVDAEEADAPMTL